jgi:hypothetical protein
MDERASKYVEREPRSVSVFVHRSVVPIRAEDLFRWHERPEALLDLMPARRLRACLRGGTDASRRSWQERC